jgi:hypothetical protein
MKRVSGENETVWQENETVWQDIGGNVGDCYRSRRVLKTVHEPQA